MTTLIAALIDNPCARATVLRRIRDSIVTGAGVSEYESEQGNGVRRHVKYGSADLPRLDREIAAAEAACGGAHGARRRTFYPSTSKGV